MTFDGVNLQFSHVYQLLPSSASIIPISVKDELADFKKEWIKSNSILIDTLYSIMLEQLMDYFPKVATAVANE